MDGDAGGDEDHHLHHLIDGDHYLYHLLDDHDHHLHHLLDGDAQLWNLSNFRNLFSSTLLWRSGESFRLRSLLCLEITLEPAILQKRSAVMYFL